MDPRRIADAVAQAVAEGLADLVENDRAEAKIEAEAVVKRPRQGNTRWSSDEDATLRFLFTRMDKEKLADLLGRTISSIRTRVSHLGLTRRPR